MLDLPRYVLLVVVACCVLLRLSACGARDAQSNCYQGTTCKVGEPCNYTVCDALRGKADANSGATSLSGRRASAGMTGSVPSRTGASPSRDAIAPNNPADASLNDPSHVTSDASVSMRSGESGSGPMGESDAAVPAQINGAVPVPMMSNPDPNSPTCVPRAETCNQLDDDCDGKIDEMLSSPSDPANCGRCGNTCKHDETCDAGECRASVSALMDAGTPPTMPMQNPPPSDAGTAPDATPPPPPPPMCGGVECRTSQVQGCCGNECTDLTTNLNCGNCGNVCGLIGAGLTCNCEKRNDSYACYGAIGAALSLCKR